MLTRLLLTLALCLAALPACGQRPPFRPEPGPFELALEKRVVELEGQIVTLREENTKLAKLQEPPPGILRVPLGVKTVDQITIPRYSDGKNHPAGHVIGWGPGSVVRASEKTQNLKVPAVITTEDHGKKTSQWSSGSFELPDYLPAILRPVVRDLTIMGHDETGSDYKANNNVVNNNIGRWNPADKFPDREHGLLIQASGPIVERVNFACLPGTAFKVTRDGGKNNGAYGPFDVEKGLIWELAANRCYRGFELSVVDLSVGRLQGYGLRDFGVKFTSGAAQIDGAIHFWGIHPGPAVWFAKTAGPCWGGPFYPENSTIGMLIESNNNRLGPIYAHSNSGPSIWLRMNEVQAASGNQLSDLDLRVRHGEAGVLIDGHCQFTTLDKGQIVLQGHGANAVRITKAGAHGGNSLKVDGITTIGTGRETAIETKVPLNRCRIEGHYQTLESVVDLWVDDKSLLGVANVIDITTYGVAKPIDLPPLFTIHESNRITVDGVQLYPPQEQE